MANRKATTKGRRCSACKGYILEDELGGLAHSNEKPKRELWFHDRINCIQEVANRSAQGHANELMRIVKEKQHGRETINKKLTEPPFVPERQS